MTDTKLKKWKKNKNIQKKYIIINFPQTTFTLHWPGVVEEVKNGGHRFTPYDGKKFKDAVPKDKNNNNNNNNSNSSSSSSCSSNKIRSDIYMYWKRNDITFLRNRKFFFLKSTTMNNGHGPTYYFI